MGNVLVAGPSGMKRAFWANASRDGYLRMLDPEWICDQVMKLRHGEYRYRLAEILREPARVDVVETP